MSVRYIISLTSSQQWYTLQSARLLQKSLPALSWILVFAGSRCLNLPLGDHVALQRLSEFDLFHLDRFHRIRVKSHATRRRHRNIGEQVLAEPRYSNGMDTKLMCRLVRYRTSKQTITLHTSRSYHIVLHTLALHCSFFSLEVVLCRFQQLFVTFL